MWDERYSSEDYAYGTAPNDFLVSAARHLPAGGRVLCLGEGEGRNAVWLAKQGYAVRGLDASAVGLAKAQRLAAREGVTIETEHRDLAEADLGESVWDGIVTIFCHLPPPLRRQVHAAAVRALRPGGIFLLEAYTPAQLVFATGGPPVVELMMDLASLREELAGLEFVHGKELERAVHEGLYHNGLAAVVQVIARKPG